MKASLASLSVMLLASCVFYRSGGTTLAMIGTDADSVSAGGLEMKEVNQSKGLEEIGDTVSKGITTTVLGSVSKAVSGDGASVARNTTRVTAPLDAATQQARIASDTAIATQQ